MRRVKSQSFDSNGWSVFWIVPCLTKNPFQRGAETLKYILFVSFAFMLHKTHLSRTLNYLKEVPGALFSLRDTGAGAVGLEL